MEFLPRTAVRYLFGDTPAGITDRWPVLAPCPFAVRWLELQRDLRRSPGTIEAYVRSLSDYVWFCERHGMDVSAAGRMWAGLSLRPDPRNRDSLIARPVSSSISCSRSVA